MARTLMSAARPVKPVEDASESAPAAAASPELARPRSSRRWLPLLLILAALVALGAWGADWLRSRLAYVHETDARVVSDMVAVASRVEGWVSALEVQAGETVAAGQPLAQVDDRSARLHLEELRAELTSLEAELGRIDARRAMVDDQTKSRLKTVESGISVAKASVSSLEHEVRLATSEYERARKLSKRGVVSTNDLDRARTVYHRTKQALLSARAESAAATAKLAEMTADRRELAVLDADARVIESKLAQHRARIARQALVVEEHRLLVPSDGVISRTFVETGEYLRPGQRIALLHDPTKIWVEANVRETEIGRLKLGQVVRIRVDAYPDMVIRGKVERIGQATTGEFALLPTPNPSGNFTKVTQRLPVRIAVEQRENLLRPGMLVEVDVEVSTD